MKIEVGYMVVGRLERSYHKLDASHVRVAKRVDSPKLVPKQLRHCKELTMIGISLIT